MSRVKGIIAVLCLGAALASGAGAGAWGAVIVNPPGSTIQGSGILLNNLDTMLNQGLIDANSSLSMTINPAFTSGGVAGFSNTGTVRASGTGGLTLLDGVFSNTGTFEVLNGSRIIFGPESVINNLPLFSSTLSGGTWRVMASGNTTTLALPGASITANAAKVTLSGAGSVFAKFNTLAANAAAGEFHLLNGRNFATAGALSNAGQIEVGAGSTLTVSSGNYTQTAGQTLINGTMAITSGTANFTGGDLAGEGTVTGNTVGGSISPGNSPGVLTIAGNLTIGNGAIYNWEVGTSGADLVHVTGNLTFGASATLNISHLGVSLPTGQDYVLFHVDGTIGPQPSWTIHTPIGWGNPVVVVQGHDVILTELVVLPEPASMALLAVGCFLITLRRKHRGNIVRPHSRRTISD